MPVVFQFGEEFSKEVEDMWCALCTWTHNIRVTINYLTRLTYVVGNMSLMLQQAKRIVVCFSRSQPRCIVNELINDLNVGNICCCDCCVCYRFQLHFIIVVFAVVVVVLAGYILLLCCCPFQLHVVVVVVLLCCYSSAHFTAYNVAYKSFFSFIFFSWWN